MRICFVAPASNYHTIKWAKWFSKKGHEVHVISFIDAEIPGATVHFIDPGVSASDSDMKKLKYLLCFREIRRAIRKIRPDIVNAHYATSYGAVTALSGIKGYVLSVWGSDVYDFPLKSPFHKALLKFSLARAGYIFSTSNAMAEEIHKYTKKNIEITPFGVDMELFNPSEREEIDGKYVIGTVKALTPKYGIDCMLRAVAEVVKERPDIPIAVRIAGKGLMEEQYKKLAFELGIDHLVTWLGFISQEKVAREWASMDVGIVASTLESESFGVSAVEAEACGTAVIVSDVPGLMEATQPGITSMVFKRKSSGQLAKAIIALYDDEELRKAMGRAGRIFAQETYELNQCFTKIEKLFEHIIN